MWRTRHSDDDLQLLRTNDSLMVDQIKNRYTTPRPVSELSFESRHVRNVNQVLDDEHVTNVPDF